MTASAPGLLSLPGMQTATAARCATKSTSWSEGRSGCRAASPRPTGCRLRPCWSSWAVLCPVPAWSSRSSTTSEFARWPSGWLFSPNTSASDCWESACWRRTKEPSIRRSAFWANGWPGRRTTTGPWWWRRRAS
uniref:Putative secreted protein n=1 Tax=Ixodes ricinus TaxID=34613 RepID=A0A6B0USE1_IXORI